VENLRRGTNPSKLVLDVANYVQHHLSEGISANEIAKTLYVSRPYLSRKFKKETGESLTDFIVEEKTKEAKRLLRYSDKTVGAIGSYLGYSSQSHFSKVFKAQVGLAPGKYREKYLLSIE
jgi:two-component system response regulator YesN